MKQDFIETYTSNKGNTIKVCFYTDGCGWFAKEQTTNGVFCWAETLEALKQRIVDEKLLSKVWRMLKQ